MLLQTPMCGDRLLRIRGDVLTVELRADKPIEGEAFLRTNLGSGVERYREVEEAVENHHPPRGRAWHDLRMKPVSPGLWRLDLPLLEIGVFEAKACLMRGRPLRPVWPEGDNLHIKVCSEATVCRNTIYTAFPRQFAQTRPGYATAEKPPAPDTVAAMDAAGYTVIPPSGTFRDLAANLDTIIREWGFRIIQLLPVHPVPTMFARMGRFGSPFAALDFYGVDPAMAEFDRDATPMDQFRELADAVHARNAYLFIDLPANHTGWASQLQIHHPEWFRKDSQGAFMSPGAWGVTWEDLCQLEYANPDLWIYMAEVFLFWCRSGVDGFRCDAGYMIPGDAWRYIVAKVRLEFPGTVFLLEGLGGSADTTYSLLAEIGLDWAYSELFQSYAKNDIEAYMPRAVQISASAGPLVCFAETHDNNRLAGVSRTYASLRTGLCALFSPYGAFGITNGAEWFATEKFDVHGATDLNWGAIPNQTTWIKRIHRVLEVHSAFHAGAELKMLACPHPQVVAMKRVGSDGRAVLVIANLDTDHEAVVPLPLPTIGMHSLQTGRDLLSSDELLFIHEGEHWSLRLSRGGVRCISLDGETAGEEYLKQLREAAFGVPVAVERQAMRALVLDLVVHARGQGDVSDIDVDQLVVEFQKQPLPTVGKLLEMGSPSALVLWDLGVDERRCVLLPAGGVLVVRSDRPFRLEVCTGETRLALAASLAVQNGMQMAVIPAGPHWQPGTYTLKATVYESEGTRRAAGTVLYLDASADGLVSMRLSGNRLRDPQACGIAVNERNTLMLARAAWSSIASKYDALLAANLDPEVPIDRTVLFTRCRAWIVYRDYSQTVDVGCQTGFRTNSDRLLEWTFRIPVGLGKHCELSIEAQLGEDQHLELHFTRSRNPIRAGFLDEKDPVELIIRPDLEDRGFHGVTKAFTGPEKTFRDAVSAHEHGFVFQPNDRLEVVLSAGEFSHEPEWQYCVSYPLEAERGLEASGDLFSPGYFRCSLVGGQTVTLTAQAASSGEIAAGEKSPRMRKSKSRPPVDELPLEEVLRRALAQFVVRRNQSFTVIAGYPWFLDWGRDTLICLRGMLAAGMTDQARDILCEFARFETRGTLPNMIRGNDHSNRDTSDAPLWLCLAVADDIALAGENAVLDRDCGGRSLLDVLRSIASHYRDGTPNGIVMDRESGLIFSPSHFTWMDTNFPAGTPRQGYPIEIQALWYRALALLAEVDAQGEWGELAEMVRGSIGKFYDKRASDARGLVDCLLASPGTPARQALADDACRPNQLFAVSLGAVQDIELRRRIVGDCARLVVPGAIRSLADAEVSVELPVYRDGVLLNNPRKPYWGHYTGDEDTRRKPAYHNGTAWTWVFPSYPEAMVAAWGDETRPAACAVLNSARYLLSEGCLGQIPELTDGDFPHRQKGCAAQAWGISEFLRVLLFLNQKN